LSPLGVAGFALNAVTGFCFLSATPGEYLFNAAFRWKVTLLLIAGLNVLVFYLGVFKRLRWLEPNTPPPLAARLAGGVSLCVWVGVMAAGRLLTFFRP
jgi:predicted benzoate:H+ symporter BenE